MWSDAVLCFGNPILAVINLVIGRCFVLIDIRSDSDIFPQQLLPDEGTNVLQSWANMIREN